eukprot:augustus_masked-scaffold_93-processed-gene-0.33-mRNA-1 protein AED:1.00 eAED:1.00 QI:0/0/0/0/1/1/4/0/418
MSGSEKATTPRAMNQPQVKKMPTNMNAEQIKMLTALMGQSIRKFIYNYDRLNDQQKSMVKLKQKLSFSVYEAMDDLGCAGSNESIITYLKEKLKKNKTRESLIAGELIKKYVTFREDIDPTEAVDLVFRKVDKILKELPRTRVLNERWSKYIERWRKRKQEGKKENKESQQAEKVEQMKDARSTLYGLTEAMDKPQLTAEEGSVPETPRKANVNKIKGEKAMTVLIIFTLRHKLRVEKSGMGLVSEGSILIYWFMRRVVNTPVAKKVIEEEVGFTSAYEDWKEGQGHNQEQLGLAVSGDTPVEPMDWYEEGGVVLSPHGGKFFEGRERIEISIYEASAKEELKHLVKAINWPAKLCSKESAVFVAEEEEEEEEFDPEGLIDIAANLDVDVNEHRKRMTEKLFKIVNNLGLEVFEGSEK